MQHWRTKQHKNIDTSTRCAVSSGCPKLGQTGELKLANKYELSEVAAARLKIGEGLDKLRLGRDRLATQTDERAKAKAYDIHRIIEAISEEVDKL